MSSGVFQWRFGRVRRASRVAGFTIIETMVVLAVTGALFVIIAATLSGRQNEAQFKHAVQSVQSQVQQTIDQVAAGFYPTQNNFSCAQSGATSISFSAGSKAQGTNDDCVFLGKVIQFGVKDTNPEQYRIYTVAGLRNATTGTSSPFQTAGAAVVGVSGNYSDYSDFKLLQYGLHALWVKVNGTATVGGIGILMEPGDFGTSNGYNSGAQPVDLVPLPGSTNEDIATAVGLYNGPSGLADPNLSSDGPINPQPDGVQVCLVSGGTNQSAILSIGNADRQLLVKVTVKNNTQCT